MGPPPLRRSREPNERPKTRSMQPRSKRQRMAQMAPTARPLRPKRMAPKSKRKARAKKTSTKKRKEKRVRKRKMARVKKKKRGMTKFSFVTQPRHFVLHIPNTPPHHHLCSQKARRDRLRQFEKKKHASEKRAKCQTNPLLT